jgi:hypothetical protein
MYFVTFCGGYGFFLKIEIGETMGFFNFYIFFSGVREAFFFFFFLIFSDTYLWDIFLNFWEIRGIFFLPTFSKRIREIFSQIFEGTWQRSIVRVAFNYRVEVAGRS